jgi:protoheme IX farnesyltransferase
MKHAIIFFIINLLAGLSILYFAGNPKAALIGIITIIWYNGIYTYFKKITAFAVVPGAITGALPPLIGWVAAGGWEWAKPIIFIEFLFFTGQIPHFWLLILKYGEEYRMAGFRSLTEIFSREQINRLTFSWVIFSTVAALFLCYFEIIQTPVIIGILLIASLYLIIQFIDLLKTEIVRNNYKKYSVILDSYFLLVLILLIADRVLIR